MYSQYDIVYTVAQNTHSTMPGLLSLSRVCFVLQCTRQFTWSHLSGHDLVNNRLAIGEFCFIRPLAPWVHIAPSANCRASCSLAQDKALMVLRSWAEQQTAARSITWRLITYQEQWARLHDKAASHAKSKAKEERDILYILKFLLNFRKQAYNFYSAPARRITQGRLLGPENAFLASAAACFFFFTRYPAAEQALNKDQKEKKK